MLELSERAEVRAIVTPLAAANQPLSLDDVAVQFSGRGAWKKRLPSLLETLEAMGGARRGGGRWLAS